MDIVTAATIVASATHQIVDAVRKAKEVEEILFKDSLSPGEIREFTERFFDLLEEFADAQTTLAEAAASIANSTERTVSSVEKIAAFFAVATVWVRQAAVLFERVLDYASRQGVDVTGLRSRMPTDNVP